MPRRWKGEHFTRRQSGGTQRRTRTPKNTYAAKQSTRSPVVDLADLEELLPALGRKNESAATPQKPKPQPKGGSKPAGTQRGRSVSRTGAS
jgi:hypothetical protein